MAKKMAEGPEWKQEEKTMVLEGEPVLHYVLNWPETADCPRLTRYSRETARRWQQRWEQLLYPLACMELARCRARSRLFRPWQCELTGESPLPWDEMASVVAAVRESAGEGMSRRALYGAVWRLRDGTPMSREMALPERYRKGRVLKAALKDAGERLRQEGVMLDRDFEKCLPMLLRRDDFWLEEGAAAFPIPQCAAAPAAEGCPVLRIAR